MKIVVTDGFAVNPGDISWDKIASLGELEVFDRMDEKEIFNYCKDAIIILSNKVPFSHSTLMKLPQLKLISVLATGYNVIDTEAARLRNITVCNVPAYGTASVAQHTFALLLELSNHVGMHADSVEKGEWEHAIDWCYTKSPVIELAGKTLGIIGFGNIAKQVAKIGQALGMRIICYTPHPVSDGEITFTDMRSLFSESDCITLHCPLTSGNREFVNSSLIQLMKPASYLINTARGQLINEKDLADALNNGKIAGAALDVLSSEPPTLINPLLSAKNCLVTPHIAWMSKEARQRVIETTAYNILSFMNGKPINVVNQYSDFLFK